MKMNNLQGRVFGRLIVLRDSNKRTKKGLVIWICQCLCGNFTEVASNNLITGNTKSCGCLRKECAKEMGHSSKGTKRNNPKHGGWGTRIYSIWKSMKKRCYNPANKSYKHYGKLRIQANGKN